MALSGVIAAFLRFIVTGFLVAGKPRWLYPKLARPLETSKSAGFVWVGVTEPIIRA